MKNKTASKTKFAINLAYMRNRKGKTMQEIATEAGISMHTWRSYEEGRSLPNVSKMPGICKAIGVFDIDKLVNSDISREK